jgi:two-component system sensor histidine kinase UhpB
VETAHGTYVVATVHDISQRKRYREFGAGLLQGAEEERQRIARDLHDDTAQRVAALLLRLQMARRAEDPAEREEMLREMHGEIIRISDGVYRILRGLRPPALEEAGVVAAIRAHVRGVLADSDLDVALQAEPVDDLLGSEAKLALYRIAQEAVTNAARHGKASSVVLECTSTPDGVCLVVTDDGMGIPDPVPETEGMGLRIMRYRARTTGAKLDIARGAGGGTVVRCTLPDRWTDGQDGLTDTFDA